METKVKLCSSLQQTTTTKKFHQSLNIRSGHGCENESKPKSNISNKQTYAKPQNMIIKNNPPPKKKEENIFDKGQVIIKKNEDGTIFSKTYISGKNGNPSRYNCDKYIEIYNKNGEVQKFWFNKKNEIIRSENHQKSTLKGFMSEFYRKLSN